MSDFSLNLQVLRGEIVTALLQNEEQLMYVLSQIAMHVKAEDLIEHLHTVGDDDEALAHWCEELSTQILADIESRDP